MMHVEEGYPLEELGSLIAPCVYDPTPERMEQVLLAYRTRPYLVAVEGGKAVGFLGYDESDGYAVIRHLAVSTKKQGCGIGRTLVDHLKKKARQIVAETDDDAVGFYRAVGFSVSPEASLPRPRYRCTLV